MLGQPRPEQAGGGVGPAAGGLPNDVRTGRDGYACAQPLRPAAGSAATPAAKGKNLRRESFIVSSQQFF
jgi:hypothetical protein